MDHSLDTRFNACIAFCAHRNLTLVVLDLVYHRTERASQLRIKDLQSLSIYMQVIVCLSLSVSVFVSAYGTTNFRVLLMVPKMFGFLRYRTHNVAQQVIQHICQKHRFRYTIKVDILSKRNTTVQDTQTQK